MSDIHRRSTGDRLRAAFAMLARHLEAAPRARFGLGGLRVQPAHTTGSGAWLLLADGRPALRVRRPR